VNPIWIGVVGLGVMGLQHVRVLRELGQFELVAVVESLGFPSDRDNADELTRVVLSIPIRDSLAGEEKMRVVEVLNSWIPPECSSRMINLLLCVAKGVHEIE
jgi:hypothetical protein